MIICIIIAYLPHFFTFVGTDIAVYYETGRRLASDGNLSLWVNYWDHKPPLIYVIFAAFTHLDYLLGNTWGLKIGVLALYIAGASLVYIALLRYCSGLGQKFAAAIGLSLSIVLALGWVDFATNGILMVLAIFLSFSGLVFAISAIGVKEALLGGVLIGLAPFFRPTALTGFGVLSLLLFINYTRLHQFKFLHKAWIASILTLAIGVALTMLLGWESVYETLISFNALYGQKHRIITSISAFLQQDVIAFRIFISILILLRHIVFFNISIFAPEALQSDV
jgi:hypothetical protein